MYTKWRGRHSECARTQIRLGKTFYIWKLIVYKNKDPLYFGFPIGFVRPTILTLKLTHLGTH